MQEFTHTGTAMGTDFSFSIVCEEEGVARALFEGARNTLRAYEERFSRFLPNSELSRLNETRSMQVSDEFLEILLEARHLFMVTQGIFNPLVQIERLGYTSSFDTLNTAPSAVLDTTYNIDFSVTTIDSETHSVSLVAGQKLDFGGFLKGFLAEMIAKTIMQSGSIIQGVIINLGGDIHTRGVDADGNLFIFSIYNPVTKKDDLQIPLRDTSLATSGTYKRAWVYENSPTHHILDATGTQNPKTNIVSASIIHESGGMSEACAKVFLSIGPEEATRLLVGHPLRSIIITNTGDVTMNIL